MAKTFSGNLFLVLFSAAALSAAFLPWKQGNSNSISARVPLTIHTESGKNIFFQVETALTEATREQGLMNRSHLDANSGMLFLFDKEKSITMWMKNTEISLDVLYISSDNIIVNIVENTTPFSTELLPSVVPVNGVLELNAGTVKKHAIDVGDTVLHSVPLPQAAQDE